MTIDSCRKDSNKKWYRELVDSPLEADAYEPLCIWLIPVLLRSRKCYYADAVARTKKLIEWIWDRNKLAFASRAAFEKSDFFQQTWEREAPSWWGLNDIIGWIDVRVCVRKREIQVSLFVPTKRISRQLRDKVYFCRRQECISLPERSTNEELRNSLMSVVETMAADPTIRRRYVDLVNWRRRLRHTDLIGIIREAADADMQMLVKKAGAAPSVGES